MTDLDLARLDQLRALATPGPWELNTHHGWTSQITDTTSQRYGIARTMQRAQQDGRGTENARLIVALVNAAPDLLRLARIGQAAETQRGDPYVDHLRSLLGDEHSSFHPDNMHPECEVCAILAAPSMAAPDPLGAAWQAAEDALPKGAWIDSLRRDFISPELLSFPKGRWAAIAITGTSIYDTGQIEAFGKTKEAALRALAAALAEVERP
jgi:hypothetical protein